MSAEAGAARTGESAGAVVFPPLLFAGALVAGLLLHWALPTRILPPWPARAAAAALLVAGLWLSRSSKAALRRAGTNVHPDKPTTAIATDGPYRMSRNPLYLATLALYLGVALLVNALWPVLLAVPLLLVLHYGVVVREERYLEAKFGDAYREYRGRVRRWLVVALLVLPLGCAGGPGPDAVTAARSVEGCYRLTVGPWLWPDGSPVGGPRYDAPPFEFPDVVRLFAGESPVPVFGHRALLPQPPAGAAFPHASWFGGPRRLVLEWSGMTTFAPMLVADLEGSRERGFEGRVQYSSDVRVRVRPFRAVRAEVAACPSALGAGR